MTELHKRFRYALAHLGIPLTEMAEKLGAILLYR